MEVLGKKQKINAIAKNSSCTLCVFVVSYMIFCYIPTL